MIRLIAVLALTLPAAAHAQWQQPAPPLPYSQPVPWVPPALPPSAPGLMIPMPPPAPPLPPLTPPVWQPLPTPQPPLR
jgi:hypothetical protein